MSTAPPVLTPPPTPIALRPESIAQTELVLTVKNLPEPWHSLDYSVEYEGQPIFTVQGFPWSIGQRRVFYDRSGLPLFELRGRWYNSSALELRLPGEMGEVILSAKLRVAVRAPRVVVKFRNAVLSERDKRKGEGKVEDAGLECLLDGDDDVTLEVRDEDPYDNTQVLVLGRRIVAHIRRITNPAELIEGQRPPFRYRSRWEVRVAQGVDVALIAVVVVILGQRVAEDAFKVSPKPSSGS
ncbi:hypothetical protein BDV23DRAFT_192021 [Aspergillus alliaceus]|uniref:Uncharacterized protein n=1 Tax=Petromyces alliaceus TaxID=209559 RepID=A0A5N7CFX8_PETAA|nr:uncharacterized protein BDW43DRAFT_297261 [Aspergillus alliaceus]KAB8237543.1 hypothetical protein BDW43DRAFT_297261 [Aspergillus alliaceus]KAE8393091.1 hypothetical protein BDV23DRAFT_192021 [Aspergillus alliaceus]